MHELGVRLATAPPIRRIPLLGHAHPGGRCEHQCQKRAEYRGVVHLTVDIPVEANGVMTARMRRRFRLNSILFELCDMLHRNRKYNRMP